MKTKYESFSKAKRNGEDWHKYRCSTCGELAGWGMHPMACERDRHGNLLVYRE